MPKDILLNSWMPNPECWNFEPRIGLNAEFLNKNGLNAEEELNDEILYAKLNLMSKSRMPNKTLIRIPGCRSPDCRIPETSISLNAEISKAEI
jgi:hypothetical protein